MKRNPIFRSNYSLNFLDTTAIRGVPDIKSGPVLGQISEKCPVGYPAGLLTESGRTNIQANKRVS